MSLKFAFALGARYVLNTPDIDKKLDELAAANVTLIWLSGWFFGHYESSLDELALAKAYLENRGFEAQIINLAFGHGSNCVSPMDPNFSLELGEGWENRVDIDGNKLVNNPCVNDKMIADTRRAALNFKNLGFTKIMYDDDTRLGHWNKNIQGCYCDRCMREFSKRIGRTITREEMKTANAELNEKWMDFTCSNVTRFMRETYVDGTMSIFNVMHNGGREHGIDIPAVREAVPNLMIRVGEGHFHEREYLKPGGIESIQASINHHAYLAGGFENCWSETTTFPIKATSPEIMMKRIEMEIRCGLRNIHMCIDNWNHDNEYSYWASPFWKALADNRERFETIAAECQIPEPELAPLSWEPWWV